MSTGFQEFLSHDSEERRAVFEEAAQQKGAPPSYIEKDFWVCFILDCLFNRIDRHAILLKGGTSLSKAYGLTSRFSEDIDLPVSRFDLGFSGGKDPASSSGKQRERLLEELTRACSDYFRGALRRELTSQIVQTIPPGDFEITPDPNDEDGCTLLFHYPQVFASAIGYVQSRVKIEGGAKSDFEPNQECIVRPYVADVLKDMDFDVRKILASSPECIFWEKAFILHGQYCGCRDEKRIPREPQLLSRHYYDLAILADSDISGKAVSNDKLRERVRSHANAMFRRAWQKLEEANPGSFHLVPEEDLEVALREDYARMRDMIMGKAPTFDEVLEKLRNLENRINRHPQK